jgi:hypothetical protein
MWVEIVFGRRNEMGVIFVGNETASRALIEFFGRSYHVSLSTWTFSPVIFSPFHR